MTQMLTDRYQERLAGTLSCYDRIVITGTLPGACYAAGMTSFLNARHIRIFDYPRFAEPLRDRIREAAQALATAQGARIEHAWMGVHAWMGSVLHAWMGSMHGWGQF